METIVVQRWRFSVDNTSSLAGKYYRILFAANGLSLTDREMQLIVYMAVNKSLDKEKFCKEFSTSAPTVNNMVAKLKKLGVLLRENGKLIVHPSMALDFEKDLKLEIRLGHAE